MRDLVLSEEMTTEGRGLNLSTCPGAPAKQRLCSCLQETAVDNFELVKASRAIAFYGFKTNGTPLI